MKRLLRYATLTSLAVREQARAERAYLGNFWIGIIGKLIYNGMFLLFIDQLFARVGQVAGFTHNDFLLMFFVSQLGYYVSYYVIFSAMQKIVLSVRTGNFDLLLLKPLPHRSFLYAGGLQPYDMLFTTAPSLLIIISQINWSALHVSLASVLCGIAIWLGGIIICNTLLFVLALPVFKSGEATDTLHSFYSVTSMAQMPFSHLPTGMKVAAFIIFPQIILAGATAEALLMKTDMLGITVLVVIAAAIAIVVVQLLWKYALRNYTSVTS